MRTKHLIFFITLTIKTKYSHFLKLKIKFIKEYQIKYKIKLLEKLTNFKFSQISQDDIFVLSV